jgi:two-component system KDP operon response regulator KdpE
MTATAISAVVARQHATLTGRTTRVAARVRPWVRLEVELCDDTGCITLRFLGRTQIPGVAVGRRLTVEGTPWLDGDLLVLVNPLYMFLDDDNHSVCTLRSGRPDEFPAEEKAVRGPATTVVLLEFDSNARRIEVATLRYGGYEVARARSLEQAITLLRARRAGAILVDPGHSDAAEIVESLRARTDSPIFVVGEFGGELDAIAVLDAGADDCISKPFDAEELLARLRASVRRARRSDVAAPFVTNDFTIDVAARRVFHSDGTEIVFTGVEFRMIEVLLRNPGHLVSREQLLEEIWGARGKRNPNYLRVFAARIRQKLEPDPAHPRYLLTVPGLGLVLDVERVVQHLEES